MFECFLLSAVIIYKHLPTNVIDFYLAGRGPFPPPAAGQAPPLQHVSCNYHSHCTYVVN